MSKKSKSPLNSPPLNPQHSPLNSQPSTLNPFSRFRELGEGVLKDDNSFSQSAAMLTA